MKETIKGVFIFLAVAGLMSCEKIKDLANVDFDTNLNTNLNIDVEDSGTKSSINSYSYIASATLDPLSDPEVEKYKEKIEDYEVNSLTATVLSVSSTDVKLLAGTFFKIYDANNNAVWTFSQDFDVVAGAEYVLDNTDGNWDKVRKVLKRNSVFTVRSLFFAMLLQV